MVVKHSVTNQFKFRVIPDIRTFLFPNQKDVHYIGGSDILPSP